MRSIAVAVFMILAAGTAGQAETVMPVHGLAMHGTPKYPAGFKHFDYVNPNAPKGGIVRQGTIGSFDSLNPFIIKGESAAGLGTMYDSLTTAATDEAFTHYCSLCETMEVPADRSWVIYNLRANGRWHDGKPITADDVVFTFKTIQEKGDPQTQFYYADIVQVEKLAPLRVKFTFRNGENRELALITGQQAILPKHYWQGREFEKTTLTPPLGSGPYRIKNLEAGRFIAYERVADYWGRDLPVNVGIDNFDVLRYDYYRDSTVLIEAFKAGEFDYRAENSSKHWATAYDSDDVKNGLMIKAEFDHKQTAGIQGYVMNTRRALFKDRRVRQALAYAFDFEMSNKTLFYGQYTRTRSYFDNSELTARGLPDAAELAILEPFRGQIPAEVFTTEYMPPATDGTGRIRQNLGRAMNLLKAAGWRIKDGKLTHQASGVLFEFEVMLVSPLFERITLPYAKNLERLGITATVRTVDTAQYIKRLETFDFDVISFIWGQSMSPGNEQQAYWGSAAAARNGSRNFPGIKDPVVDALIEKVIAAPDRESLITATRALDRVLQWGHYLVPQWHIAYDRTVFWDKFGRPETLTIRGSPFGTWWIDREREKKLAGRIQSVPR